MSMHRWGHALDSLEHFAERPALGRQPHSRLRPSRKRRSRLLADRTHALGVLGVRRFGLLRSSFLIKRSMDVVCSALGLVLMAPLAVGRVRRGELVRAS